MKLIKTVTWSAAFAAGLFLGAATHHTTANAAPLLQSSSQQPTPNPDVNRDRAGQDRDRNSKEAEPASITGELTRVNPQSMTFSVKSVSGAEMLFRYDERTIVTGAENNVAGLATSNGADVTVTYRNDSAGNMASKIEVHAKR